MIEVLGKFNKSWAELARGIRKEVDSDVSSTQKLKSPVLYHGREVFVSMWSGDTRSMVKLAQNLLEQISDTQLLDLPITPEIQNKEFRRTGGEFLHLLKACARTAKGKQPMEIYLAGRPWTVVDLQGNVLEDETLSLTERPVYFIKQGLDNREYPW